MEMKKISSRPVTEETRRVGTHTTCFLEELPDNMPVFTNAADKNAHMLSFISLVPFLYV